MATNASIPSPSVFAIGPGSCLSARTHFRAAEVIGPDIIGERFRADDRRRGDREDSGTSGRRKPNNGVPRNGNTAARPLPGAAWIICKPTSFSAGSSRTACPERRQEKLPDRSRRPL